VRASSALRASVSTSGGDETGEEDDGRPRLRLVVTRGKLAIELARPFALGALEVRELALSLPDARFPVDLSGGVQAFRNRRGRLEQLVVAVRADAQRWTSELRVPFGGARPEVVIAPNPDGWFVGARGGSAAIAFSVVAVASGEDVRLIPVEARAVGLEAPPQAVALAMVLAATRPYGRLLGGVVLVERAARLLVEHVLPLSGVRAPSSDGIEWSAPTPEVGALVFGAGTRDVMTASPRAVRAAEAASLAADGDEALLRGQLDPARAAYLAALERAPRHAELVRRIAEIDRAAGRPDVGLGVLADLGGDADVDGLMATLLGQTGDPDGARLALERAAETEPYGALAAAYGAQLAALLGGKKRLDALDRAVSRAPTWTELRWRRFEARLTAGDVAGAVADAGELEVAARGAERKHAIATRIAEALMREHHVDPATRWFERALRYRPDGADALVGLARALGVLGQPRRALDLHRRAVSNDRTRPGGDGHARPALVLELARALAEHADDRPAAIAHVRSIPPLLPESFEARWLEGRWRSELGDTAGASEAFARLGDEVERAMGALVVDGAPSPHSHRASFEPERADVANAITAYLEEAARIEEHDRGDLLAARRLLGLALRLCPRRPSLRASFRRVANERSMRADGPAVEATLSQRVDPASLQVANTVMTADADERLVEALTERVRANPSEFSLVLELADVLERLGRDHDLLALLSARIDEEDEPRRSRLVPRRCAVLERLQRAATVDGRHDEAQLYALLLQRE
jgi:tetratricopeptide (TPR) repeat protein